MVDTGKFVLNSKTFHGLLKDLPAVFKDYKIMKNIEIYFSRTWKTALYIQVLFKPVRTLC